MTPDWPRYGRRWNEVIWQPGDSHVRALPAACAVSPDPPHKPLVLPRTESIDAPKEALQDPRKKPRDGQNSDQLLPAQHSNHWG